MLVPWLTSSDGLGMVVAYFAFPVAASDAPPSHLTRHRDRAWPGANGGSRL